MSEGSFVGRIVSGVVGEADQLQTSLQSLLMPYEVGLLHILGLLAQDGGIGLEFLEGLDGLATNWC